MSALSTVLTALYSEIEAAIVGITPTDFAAQRFAVRRVEDSHGRDFYDVPGRARLFEVQPARYQQPTGVGAAYRLTEVLVPVSVWYPTRRDWVTAATDDLDRIAEYMRDTPTAVSGVQLREIDLETQPSWAVSEEDPQWAAYEFAVWALVETSP